MDGFELNKVAGAILLAGVIAMFTGVLSRILIPTPHMEESIIVATGEEPAQGSQTVTEATLEPVAPLLASASVEDGMQVARKCQACHTFEQGGANRVGPNLWNIIGASKAHLDSFSYSSAMAEAEGEWTYADLNAYLHKPREFVPGTKMSFAGLSKVEDRASVIAYLRSLSDNPQPLPEPEPEAPAETQQGEGTAPADGGAAAPADGGATAPADGGAAGEATGGTSDGANAPAQDGAPAQESAPQNAGTNGNADTSGQPASGGESAAPAAGAEQTTPPSATGESDANRQ